MLDREKHFTTLRGTGLANARYIHDGVRYSQAGNYANPKERQKHQDILKDAATAAAMAAKDALEVAMAASKDAEKEVKSFK